MTCARQIPTRDIGCAQIDCLCIAWRSQAPEKLPIIDMTELVRLYICEEIDDTWSWVSPGPERQQVAATSAPEAVEAAPVVDEGAQADPAPVQAPQPPPPARTMP
ncbi:hypothetical protein Tco_1468130 [Tanacetum coccineum]